MDTQQQHILDDIVGQFEATLSAGSAPAVAITCQVEGVLQPEDLREYLDEHGNLRTTVKAEQKDIRTLRAQHHSVARLLAEGIPEGVVAEITGYTQSHISTLKNTPAMVELITHYRAPGNLAAKHIGENLRRVGSMALEELERKIEAGALSPTELTQAAKLGLDRSGHGPQSTVGVVAEHHLFDHSEIQLRHREAKRRDAELIVHPEEVRKALPKPEGDTSSGD